MKKTPPRATITELSKQGGITDLSVNTIRKHIKANKIKKGEDGKYDTQTVLDTILKNRQETGQGKGPSAMTKVRTTKYALECQTLQVKLDHMKGKLISIEEHSDEITQVVNIHFDGMKFFRQRLAATRKDPQLLKDWDAADQEMREHMMEQIPEGE